MAKDLWDLEAFSHRGYVGHSPESTGRHRFNFPLVGGNVNPGLAKLWLTNRGGTGLLIMGQH